MTEKKGQSGHGHANTNIAVLNVFHPSAEDYRLNCAGCAVYAEIY
jgi:hypothetical protein